jgi:ParB-like chromosome segregation protein Spo0J
MNQVLIQEIPIELLKEHPENSNFMNAPTAQKLRRHIEQTGRYEPLTVRPHPVEEGKFQVINGHNRLRILRALEYQYVNCIVWKLDDQQTRLYLATLNRLSGQDIPERRAILLDNLLHSFDIDELGFLLPDDRKNFSADCINKGNLKVPFIIDFMLDELEAKELNLALDLVINTKKKRISRSQALVMLASFYIRHHVPMEE